MKNTVKLNESQLRDIVTESVKKVLSEGMEEGLGDKIKSAVGNGLGKWQRGRYENWNPVQRAQDKLKAMGQGADTKIALESLENLMKKYSWLSQYVQVDWNAINQLKQQKGPYGYGA